MSKPLFSQKTDWVIAMLALIFICGTFFIFNVTTLEIFTGQSWYLLIKDLFTLALTLSGVIIASQGLATWKKQVKGIKEFEAAYNLQYSILELRDAIKHVRNPGIWPSESNRATQYAKAKYPEKPSEEIEKSSHPYVYEMRWEEIIKASTKMESHLLAAEVLWGPDILKLIKPLNKKITELNISLQQHFQPDLRTKDYKEIRTVIYDMGGENEEDAFSIEIARAVKDILDYIKDQIS